MSQQPALGLNLLVGAAKIARFLSDDTTERQVQYYHETKKLPIRKLGRHLIAQPDELRAAVLGQDSGAEEAA